MNKRARMLYATELMRQGFSNTEIKRMLREKYGIAKTTAEYTVKDAYQWLQDNDTSGYPESVRVKQVERTEYILQQAIAEKRWSTANNILDNLNKLLGLYETKQKLEIVGDEIKFRFGAEQQTEVVDGEKES